MGHTKHGRLRRKCSVAGQQCRNTEGLKWKCTLYKQESHQKPEDDIFLQLLCTNDPKKSIFYKVQPPESTHTSSGIHWSRP